MNPAVRSSINGITLDVTSTIDLYRSRSDFSISDMRYIIRNLLADGNECQHLRGDLLTRFPCADEHPLLSINSL